MSFSTGGEGPCPYHKRVRVKWEVKPSYPLVTEGKIECLALSEDGSRCQVDLGPCPAGEILDYFISGKPVRRKGLK